MANYNYIFFAIFSFFFELRDIALSFSTVLMVRTLSGWKLIEIRGEDLVLSVHEMTKCDRRM